MKKYSTAVVIGRFHPVHIAHQKLLKTARDMADRLIVIVGSAYQPRTYKNPWTFEERKQMILHALDGDTGNVIIVPNIDTIYNDEAWTVRIQEIVDDNTIHSGPVVVVGHKKDNETTGYLESFPQWDYVDIEPDQLLNATDIRDIYFRRQTNMNYVRAVVPDTTFRFLEGFMGTDAYQNIIASREHIAAYKKQFAHLPYDPVFVTVDAVLIQCGHVLVVRRRSHPGKGLYAFPGGFLNAKTDKTILDGAIRELKEETGIKVPVPVLKGSVKDGRVFDAVNRSERGRVITHAFKIVLPDGPMPKVKGMDDADKAMWVPISEIRSDDMFEDHYDILQHFIGA